MKDPCGENVLEFLQKLRESEIECAAAARLGYEVSATGYSVSLDCEHFKDDFRSEESAWEFAVKTAKEGSCPEDWQRAIDAAKEDLGYDD